MAEESTQRQIILDFELKATQALKDAASLQYRLKELREEQKNLDMATEEGQQEYQRYAAEIKSTSAQLRTTQTQIANTMKAQSAMSGEVEKQRAKLAALTAEWTRLRKEDENYVAKDAALQKAMSETTAAIKAAEEAHGDHRRSVGDYEKAAVSLKQELRGLTEELMRMSAAGQTGSEEFNTLMQRAQELKDAQTDVNSVLSKGADDTEKNMLAIGDAVGGVIAAYGLYQTVVGGSNEENRESNRIIKTLTITYGALTVVTKAWVAIQKESAVYANAENLLRKIGIDRVKMQAKAEAAMNAVRGKGTILTKANAAATWLWNAALSANPIVVVVAGVTALAAGLYGLSKAFGASEQAARDAYTVLQEYNTLVEATDKTLSDIEENRAQSVHDAEITGRKEVDDLKNSGASKLQILQAQRKSEEAVREAERVSLIKSGVVAKEALQDLRDEWARLDNASRRATSQDDLDKIREQQEQVNDKIREYTKLLNDSRRELEALSQTEVESETKYREEVANITYESRLKQLDQQKTVNESLIKAEAGYQSEDFALRQQYAKRLNDLSVKTELDRLTLSRKYGKITEAEYQSQLAALNNAMQEFANNQAKEANDYYIAQREGILSMFDQNAQEQINKVNERYAKALEQLKSQDMRAPDASAYEGGTGNKDYQKAQKEYEAFLFQRAEIEYRLEKQKQEEIANIEENSLRARTEKIEMAISRQYDDDLRKYQDNERKKTEITIQQLEAQKSAKEKEGLDTYDEDAQLLEARRQLNQMDLDAGLLSAGENAKAKYEARKTYLDKEMALAAGNVDRQKELNAEALANEQEYMQARIGEIEKWASASMDLMYSVNDLFNALDDAKLQKAQEDYDKQSEMLKEQLDQGYITQEEYDRKQKALDKDLEKEQKKIARQQAIREKAMSMFQIAINTALGIMKAVAASPLTGGLPWSAIVGAMGAVQLAAVAAQPLPKAARGRKIKGRSHAQGGELVVAEDGEIIMNKRSVSMFGPLLSEISVAGGGIPFTSHIPDGGYTARWAMSNTLSREDIREAMADAVKDVKIYTAIEDIRREDGNYSTVEARGTV